MKKILVVEDERCIRELVAAIFLRHDECVVMTEANPERALELCHAERFDVLITDLNMPEMSGLDLVRRLRDELAESQAPARNILMTTDNDAGRRAHASGLFAGVIYKPFGMLELTKHVLSN